VSEPLLVVVLGPTASGKTSLSLFLAEQLGGEIVSCDSVAVYRELELGTAKPAREERRRVPHHLIDIAAPTEQITAGDYARLARQAIREIHERGRLPIVVGGTGLYLRALLEGLFEYLHRLLQRLDPAAAKAIHANDVPKVIRAVEVSLGGRRPMTEMWRQGRDPLPGFRVLRIGLNPDRGALYERINARAKEMFSAGLIEETQALAGKYGEAVRPLGSLGYRQAAQYLAGEVTLEAAIAAAQQGHRNYAKRQMTWFRREPDVYWFQGFGSEGPVRQRCLELVLKEMHGQADSC
jgi:tRNA dimethylallyltransferase